MTERWRSGGGKVVEGYEWGVGGVCYRVVRVIHMHQEVVLVLRRLARPHDDLVG